MSRKPDKVAKRKAKLKARKIHAEQHRLHLAGRVAGALMDLCADVLPEYVNRCLAMKLPTLVKDVRFARENVLSVLFRARLNRNSILTKQNVLSAASA